MAIQGLRHTGNFVEGQRPKNWREGILMNWPNGEMTLTGLTSQMRTSKTDDPEFYWWEKQMPSQRFQLSADPGTSGNLSLDGGEGQLMAGHIIRIEETGEICLVTQDGVSGQDLQVERGFADTGSKAAAFDPTASDTNPYVLIVGSANEEGSTAPTGINYDPVKRYNYTQIFRNTLEMTRTASKTRLRTREQVNEARRECLELHGIEMEKAFWFGRRYEGFRNGQPMRLTGGIQYFIEEFGEQAAGHERVWDVEGNSITLWDLEEIMKYAFLWGSDEKMMILGNQALQTIQRAVRYSSYMELDTNQREYGMNVSRLFSPFGTLVLKTHPLFNYAPGGANFQGLNSWGFVLDMEHIRYRPFEGADTKYQRDLQENDMDGMKAGYLTEAGIEVNHPENHMLIKGLTSAAKEDVTEKPPELESGYSDETDPMFRTGTTLFDEVNEDYEGPTS